MGWFELNPFSKPLTQHLKNKGGADTNGKITYSLKRQGDCAHVDNPEISKLLANKYGVTEPDVVRVITEALDQIDGESDNQISLNNIAGKPNLLDHFLSKLRLTRGDLCDFGVRETPYDPVDIKLGQLWSFSDQIRRQGL